MSSQSTTPNPNVHIEWLYNRRLVIFTLDSGANAVVDDWAEMTRQVLVNWDKSKPIYVMHDYLRIRLLTMRYILQKAQQLADLELTKTTKGYLAIVVKNNIFAEMTNLFIRGQSGTKPEIRLFSTREQGLNWLRKMSEIQGQPLSD